MIWKKRLQFVPATELERAYIQSVYWDADRLWHRCARAIDEKRFATASAYCLSLLLFYIRSGTRNDERIDGTVSSLIANERELTSDEKASLFKCVCHALGVAHLGTVPVLSYRMRALLAFAFLILDSNQWNASSLVDMRRRLTAVFDNSIDFSELQRLSRAREPGFETLENIDHALDQYLGKKDERPENIDLPAPVRPQPEVLPPGSVKFPVGGTMPPAELTKTEYNKVKELGQLINLARGKYGVKSIETANALVHALLYEPIHRDMKASEPYLHELGSIISNWNTEISNYDLRKIYSLTGSINWSDQLLPLVGHVHMLIRTRLDQANGLDMSMFVPLARLMTLWASTGQYKEAEEFCRKLMEQSSASLHELDLVARQVRSANSYIELLRTRATKAADHRAWPLLTKSEEPAEFIAMLSVVALDHSYFARKNQCENVLMEMLAYYEECEGETARLVGEMLWLLLETDLVEYQAFIRRLLEISAKKAHDAYLGRRVVLHLRRAIRLSKTQRAAVELVDYSQSIVDTTSTSIAWNIGRLYDAIEAPDVVKSLRQRECDLDAEVCQRELSSLLASPDEIGNVDLARINDLAEVVLPALKKEQSFAQANELIASLMAIGIQPRDEANRLLLRQADINVFEDKVFDSIAIMYIAFTSIPEPYDDEESGAEPFVLNLLS